jgi:hypothetical protein
VTSAEESRNLIGRAAQKLYDVVDKSVIIVIQPFPAEIDRHGRQDIGQVKEGAEEAAHGDLPVKQHGDDHGVYDGKNDRYACILHCGQQGTVKLGIVCKQLDVVFQPHKFHFAQTVPAEQTQGEGGDHGQIGDADQTDDGG